MGLERRVRVEATFGDHRRVTLPSEFELLGGAHEGDSCRPVTGFIAQPDANRAHTTARATSRQPFDPSSTASLASHVISRLGPTRVQTRLAARHLARRIGRATVEKVVSRCYQPPRGRRSTLVVLRDVSPAQSMLQSRGF